MKYIAVIIVAFIITACSSSVKVIERQVPVIVETPAVVDSFELEKKEENGDTLFYGVFKDSLQNEIGKLKVFFEKKFALISIKPRVDTITVKLVDTIKVKETEFLPIINEQLSLVEKIILYSGIGLIFSFITWWRVKKYGKK